MSHSYGFLPVALVEFGYMERQGHGKILAFRPIEDTYIRQYPGGTLQKWHAKARSRRENPEGYERPCTGRTMFRTYGQCLRFVGKQTHQAEFFHNVVTASCSVRKKMLFEYHI